MYRKGVGAFIINHAKQVFVAARADMQDLVWQLPQGGIEDHETPLAALKRELIEEMGLKSLTVLKESDHWFFYDFPEHLKAHIFHGRYQGQQQKWFLILFNGSESEINIHQPVPEFKACKWVSLEDFQNLPRLSFKANLYADLFSYFSSFIHAHDFTYHQS